MFSNLLLQSNNIDELLGAFNEQQEKQMHEGISAQGDGEQEKNQEGEKEDENGENGEQPSKPPEAPTKQSSEPKSGLKKGAQANSHSRAARRKRNRETKKREKKMEQKEAQENQKLKAATEVEDVAKNPEADAIEAQSVSKKQEPAPLLQDEDLVAIPDFEIREIMSRFEEVAERQAGKALGIIVDTKKEEDHADAKKDGHDPENEEDLGNDPEAEENVISKKRRKLMNRMTVFELKMRTSRPDLVDNWDVTAPDPLFLLKLKQIRNSVPVPDHWSTKRRYLQYKRGVHKKPFRLPDFIENTGINKMRERSGDENKTLKQRMRERIQPKMGKIEIDYGLLHDAFFKHQKPPPLSMHGQIYFEGMENEIKINKAKPGRLSPAMIEALGIADNGPPPWILNMQRYGPPPAYPSLKIPGVTMPIPAHLQVKPANEVLDGEDRGGLFKDENGYTVYADCHGLNKAVYEKRVVKKTYWGQLPEEQESSNEEDQDEDDSSDVEDSEQQEIIDSDDLADPEEQIQTIRQGLRQ